MFHLLVPVLCQTHDPIITENWDWSKKIIFYRIRTWLLFMLLRWTGGTCVQNTIKRLSFALVFRTNCSSQDNLMSMFYFSLLQCTCSLHSNKNGHHWGLSTSLQLLLTKQTGFSTKSSNTQLVVSLVLTYFKVTCISFSPVFKYRSDPSTT